MTYKTNESIYHINITVDHIVDIISKMSSNKAGGCDMISVRMLQLCPLEVATPLQIIFQKCIDTGIFPDSWKYANVQPVHKKNNRQTKSNYRPISLLPICGKLLEKSFSITSTISSTHLIYYQKTNQVSGQGILLYTSSFQLHLIFINLLRALTKHEPYS